MKTLNIVLIVVLGLIMFMPILGALGIFPAPTADMYNTAEAYDFINMLMTNASYINYIMAVVFAFSIFLVATNRMALLAILILPITVNIFSFHTFLDGGMFTGGAVMANILLALNVYFLWQNREKYKIFWDKSALS